MHVRKLFLLLSLMLVFLPGTQVRAQEHYTRGPVWRVIYIHVKPAKFDAVMTDLREHFKVIAEEEKRQGLILDYKVFLNPVSNEPNDWNIALAIQYKNWAALDSVAEKIDAITLKHYGSKEARQAAAEKRVELGQVIANRLAREVTLK